MDPYGRVAEEKLGGVHVGENFNKRGKFILKGNGRDRVDRGLKKKRDPLSQHEQSFYEFPESVAKCIGCEQVFTRYSALSLWLPV